MVVTDVGIMVLLEIGTDVGIMVVLSLVGIIVLLDV